LLLLPPPLPPPLPLRFERTLIWDDILYEINITSKLLQSPSLDLSEAINQLNITKKFMKNYRSEGFKKILETAKEVAK